MNRRQLLKAIAIAPFAPAVLAAIPVTEPVSTGGVRGDRHRHMMCIDFGRGKSYSKTIYLVNGHSASCEEFWKCVRSDGNCFEVIL